MLKENLPHCRLDFDSLLARIQPALELVDPADLSQMRSQINKLAVDRRVAYIDHVPFRRAMTKGPLAQAVNDFVEYFSENGFYQNCVGLAEAHYSGLDEHTIREIVFFSIWQTFFRLPDWQGEITEKKLGAYIKESLKRACRAACRDNNRGHSPLEEEGEQALSIQRGNSVIPRPTEEEARAKIAPPSEPRIRYIKGGWFWERQTAEILLTTASGLLNWPTSG